MMARDGFAWLRGMETRMLSARIEALAAATQTNPTAPNLRGPWRSRS